MPIDPSIPASSTPSIPSPANATPIRENFAAIKAITDAHAATLQSHEDASTQIHDGNVTRADFQGVEHLGFTVSDPPTQAEVQSIYDKLDAILGILRGE